ncbi:MAG: DUF4870 domain-containing protein [Planctomycetota bacterium]
MAEINETPETPIGEPGAEQPAGTTPPTGAEQPASAESPASAEQPVSSEPAASPQQPVNAQPTETSEEVNKDARMWAMFCHLAALGALVVPVVGSVIGPLVIWQIKKDDFPFVDEQGKEAVNFQISMLLYAVIGSVVCLITCVGAPLMPIVWFAVIIVDLIFLLIAAVKANNGFHYRYPLTIRFIK